MPSVVRVCVRGRPPSRTAGHPRGVLCPSGVGPGLLRAPIHRSLFCGECYPAHTHVDVLARGPRPWAVDQLMCLLTYGISFNSAVSAGIVVVSYHSILSRYLRGSRSHVDAILRSRSYAILRDIEICAPYVYAPPKLRTTALPPLHRCNRHRPDHWRRWDPTTGRGTC